jgi:LuxR family transcriptional regulator, maltose regulon positive regulatory protein
VLLNGIAAQPRELFLFLDDCHLLVESSVLGLIALLCRRAPKNLHIVMLSRSDLPNSVMSRATPENLLEVDASMLKFDLDETSQLVRKLKSRSLKPEEVSGLHSTTEGWPAAIRAILLSLDSGMKPQLSGKSLPPSRPISALMEDVLEHLPDDVSEFMVRVSVVDKVCVRLANAMTRSDAGQAMFDQICQRQLFFSARDPEQVWFSFHPLFRDQLQRRLSERPADARELNLRAAQWFADNDLWSNAVDHALAANDRGRAIQWIEQCAMKLLQAGDLLTLLSWRRQLHSHLLQMPVRLKLAFAWALGHAMATTDASQLLAEIESELRTDDAHAEHLRLECVAVRALLKNVDDDGDAADRLAREYLDSKPPDPWIENVMLNIVATTHLRTGQWKAFYSVPPLAVTDEDGAASGRFVFNRCYHLCYRGIAEYHQGRLADAATLFEQAMRIGDTQAERFGIVATPEGAVWVLPAALLAQVRYQQNRQFEATALLDVCLQPARIVAPLDFVAAAFQTAVRLAQQKGLGLQTGLLLDEADRLARSRGWTRFESMNLLERVRLCLIAGRLPEAEGCLARLKALTLQARDLDVRKAYIARDAFLAHAWVDVADGAAARRVPELQRRLEASESAQLPLEAARFAATLGLVHAQQGDHAKALRAWHIACGHAARAGAPRLLLDLPVPLETVLPFLNECRAALAPDSPVAFFLAGVVTSTSGGSMAEPLHRGAIGALSGKERLVLQLVAQGRSNKEIARTLGVAPDTIKYHLKSVFSKLRVGNRAQAAVRAKSFGLT